MNTTIHTHNPFLCGACRRTLCPDCRSIANEYAELLQARTRALAQAEQRIEALQRELQFATQRTQGYERIATLGLPAALKEWMDNQVNGAPRLAALESVAAAARADPDKTARVRESLLFLDQLEVRR